MSTNHSQQELYRKIKFLQEEYKELLDNYRERGAKIHELSQIVKDVKEVISRRVEEDGFIEPEIGLLEIEKILEGDNE